MQNDQITTAEGISVTLERWNGQPWCSLNGLPRQWLHARVTGKIGDRIVWQKEFNCGTGYEWKSFKWELEKISEFLLEKGITAEELKKLDLPNVSVKRFTTEPTTKAFLQDKPLFEAVTEDDFEARLLKGSLTYVHIGTWKQPRKLHENQVCILLEVALGTCSDCKTCTDRKLSVEEHLGKVGVPHLWCGQWLILVKQYKLPVLKYLSQTIGQECVEVQSKQ